MSLGGRKHRIEGGVELQSRAKKGTCLDVLYSGCRLD